MVKSTAQVGGSPNLNLQGTVKRFGALEDIVSKRFPLKSSKQSQIRCISSSTVIRFSWLPSAVLAHGTHMLHHIAPHRMANMALVGQKLKIFPAGSPAEPHLSNF